MLALSALLAALQAPLPAVASLAPPAFAPRARPPLTRQEPADSGDPPGRAARLALLEGPVYFQPSGDTAWSEASVNYALTTGDRLYAEAGGRAELQAGDVTLRIGTGSDLILVRLTDDFLQASLSSGVLRASVYDLAAGDSVELDTPNGAVMLRSAGAYRLDVADGGRTTTLTVDSGLADVYTGEAVQSVESGRALRLEGVGPTRVARAVRTAPDDFDRWSAARDRPLDASASARYVGRNVAGYADLDDAGTWVAAPEYGWVWYPRVVVVGWAPYRYGHWVWVDPWGWTWVDDAPWGWAPFHYGRWVIWGGRWVWVPGPVVRRPCYAPALVVFVTFTRVSVQGWFPLGPREPFHPWYHHTLRYRERVNPWGVPVRERDVVYVNRPHVVAVPVDVIRGAEPVARRTVPVSVTDIRRAVIVPHPPVQPLPRAAAGGPPAPRPPEVRRPEVRVVPRREVTPPAVTPRPRQAPAREPAVPPAQQPVRPVRPVVPPPGARPAQPPPQPRPQVERRRAPPVVVKNPPAPQALPFPVREKAMQQDPGRPLDPAQRRNLRQGKPAGPPSGAAPARPAPKKEAPAKRTPPKR